MESRATCVREGRSRSECACAVGAKRWRLVLQRRTLPTHLPTHVPSTQAAIVVTRCAAAVYCYWRPLLYNLGLADDHWSVAIGQQELLFVRLAG